MIELYQARVTILKVIKEAENKATSKSIRAIMGIASNSNFSSHLFELERTGFLYKKKPKDDHGNIWSLSKKGIKHLSDNSADIVSYTDVAQYYDEWNLNSKNKNAVTTSAPRPKISKKASSAMDGIANLIEENDRIIATLTSMYRQLGDALGIDEQEVEDQPIN